MMTTIPDIAIEDVSFAYARVPVLENVNLTIAPGEKVCIVGPNGGGKTTLIKLILGLLIPDQGNIRVFGDPPRRAARRIGYVPQYAHYDPDFPVTVFDVVLMGRLHGPRPRGYSREDEKAATRALENMHLASLAHRLFSEISGGQRQRVLIARALATGNRLLIMDEPTANIDAGSEQYLFDLLSAPERDLTVLMITHEMGVASRFFESIVCVNRQVVVHPTSELTGENIREIYGGDPLLIRHDHRCSLEGHSHD